MLFLRQKENKAGVIFMKRNIIILCCVLLVLSGAIIFGYFVGKIHSPNVTTSTEKFSGKIKKKDIPEEQINTIAENQEQVVLPKKEQNLQNNQQKTVISRGDAKQIVSSDYQSDGHIVVMSEDDNSYTIGCFWEMYFDEETGEPRFNMQAAEYVIDKYNGKILSVKKQENNTTNTTEQQKDMYFYYYQRYQEIESNVEYLYDNAYSTADLVEAGGNELNEWDNLLNEVYNYIKQTISSKEFEKLRESERNWINERDKNAEEAANFDGSAAALEYNGSMISQTKERIIWLIENYI